MTYDPSAGEPYDGMPITDDAGEVVGHAFQADGGEWVMVRDGEVVTAVGPDGSDVDPADFEFAAGEPEDPRYAELSEGLDRIEQRMAEANERSRNQMFVPAEQSAEAIRAAFEYDRADLESALGRPMTVAEQRTLAERALSTVEAGGDPSLIAAANELDDLGRSPIHDTSTHEGRSRYMFERAKEADPASAPDAVTGQEQRRAESYDLSTHEGRVDYGMDKMAGHDVEGREHTPDQEGME